ncbi:TRAP transporter substrate-binding protein [Pseudooceanicola sp. CBS1P-1]|uniref:C4-dicarboxylate ABC transporter substrate-binding protein n=1 Tax=Pseudooceanicola albus TaxID=2692189 RepID=A0A6L7G5Y8_9RHOB|nr:MULTISPECIES: TRAP transporter substrate-binding protein [Pseudooceanicola]MBT9385335.1 TRAP transporter substrate-binding protein [Pseudooceanicola endophyticus]MXN18806.1 hypothetical protein [Pseudooceanicola albus]
MKTLLATTAFTLALAIGGVADAQSINIALDANPDREKSGTFRYADNLLTNLKAEGWKTEAFPLNAIGGEDERLDQIRSGILDVSMSNFAVATQMVPEMRVLQLPYAFENPDHEFKFFTESDYLATVNKQLESDGMHILAVVPNGGFLGIFNDEHEVKTVADMKGLRMRALDPSQLEMFKMMGANGVVIPFSEVPNAIQTGIADGYVNASSVPLTFGQADLFSNFTDAKVIMSARLALVSTAWWDDLSDAEKQQVNDASKKALAEVFQWVDDSEATHKKELEAAGVAVYEPSKAELATFKEATTEMKGTVPNVKPERIDAILKMISDYAPE